MDLNRLFTMLLRLFFNRAMSHGINFLARRGKAEVELTPEERRQSDEAKAMADKARKAARLTARLWR